MLLSPTQISELLQIVDIYSVTFLANKVGPSILTRQDKELLKNAGFSIKQINEAETDTAKAFKFGMLSIAMNEDAAKSMTYSGFKKYLSSGKFFPLSQVEKNALERVKYQMSSETKRLSSNMKSDIERQLVVIDKGRAIHSKGILDATKKAIEDRKSVAQLAGELGKLTEQWDRDMGRIADYVMHEAFNEGRVMQIRKGSGKVYFDVYTGACKHCIRLYLKIGIGSEPRVFTVDELQSNGSNVKKKPDQWKATIAGIHPYCRCTATEYPEGFIWDPSLSMFVAPKSPKRKVKRKSTVKVTVGNKTTKI